MDVSSKNRQPLITCNQGPPPPNPLVVERFQSVVSQLFQQVSHAAAASSSRSKQGSSRSRASCTSAHAS